MRKRFVPGEISVKGIANVTRERTNTTRAAIDPEWSIHFTSFINSFRWWKLRVWVLQHLYSDRGRWSKTWTDVSASRSLSMDLAVLERIHRNDPLLSTVKPESALAGFRVGFGGKGGFSGFSAEGGEGAM